jgi:hypothetical protein
LQVEVQAKPETGMKKAANAIVVTLKKGAGARAAANDFLGFFRIGNLLMWNFVA